MTALDSPAQRRDFALQHVVPAVDLRPFINGEYRQARSVESLDVLDPGTGARIVAMPAASELDTQEAVSAAREAFDNGPWPRLSASQRANYLNRLAELIERDHQKLSLLEALDTGKLYLLKSVHALYGNFRPLCRRF